MGQMLCAVSDGAVIMRRKSVVMPIALLIAGIGLFVLNCFIESSVENGNLKSALVLFGAIFAIVGVVIFAIRVSGTSQAPYCLKDGCFLNKRELKFAKEEKNEVVDLVHKGDFTTLRKFRQSDVSTLVVVEYSSPKSALEACQVFEYVELELRPISDLKLKVK
ncbi:MAG: hypothetical protein IKY82_04795 [Alistipes sp.]|nr:hypothetical protein [Alistipes sp.]